MFEWLDQEISAIKTPRFHLVDGPADPKLRESIMRSQLAIPSSYREFVLRFGNAKLYRRSRSGYLVVVFAGPREATLNNGTIIYHLGFQSGTSA